MNLAELLKDSAYKLTPEEAVRQFIFWPCPAPRWPLNAWRSVSNKEDTTFLRT